LHFDTSIIRASDSAGLKNQISIGLTSEESCKILDYANSSSKLRSLHISGFDLKNDAEEGAELIACLIWYAINGRQKAKSNQGSTESMDKYIVELDEMNLRVKFWKDINSERWWIEIPKAHKEKNLVPCSEEEYNMACQNKMSDRLFYLFSNR